MALAASLSYLASLIETDVRSHEQGIKNFLDYVNLSEAIYDDIVVAANGFSGTVYKTSVSRTSEWWIIERV